MNSGLTHAARALLAATLMAGAAFFLNAETALAAPAVIPPFTLTYTLTTFNGVAPAGDTNPDDLAVSADGLDLWVGYGNTADTKGGKGGGPSNLVEYEISSGTVLQNIPINGHLDGLKIDPATGNVWATENEDGSPTLAIVNPKNGKFKIFTVSSPLVTGGFDDLVFDGTGVFIVTSSQADTTTPVIVQVSGKMKKKTLSLTSVLGGAPPKVLNVVTNTMEVGDIGDPDSMTIDPAGELVLDNRALGDGTPSKSLYIVRNPNATNPVLRVPLTLAGAPSTSVELNDTIFPMSETTGEVSSAGVIFITDTSANAIYMLTKPYFAPNEIYAAANGLNEVGLLDFNTGVFVPVVMGFKGVHGLAFSPTSVAISSSTK